MNKDKRITFRVSSEEYEKIKKKSKELGFPNSSRYVRIKVEADNDELIFNSKKIIGIYDKLFELEMELDEIKMEAGLADYEVDYFESTFASLAEQAKTLK